MLDGFVKGYKEISNLGKNKKSKIIENGQLDLRHFGSLPLYIVSCLRIPEKTKCATIKA